jgi:hypothetical protein
MVILIRCQMLRGLSCNLVNIVAVRNLSWSSLSEFGMQSSASTLNDCTVVLLVLLVLHIMHIEANMLFP